MILNALRVALRIDSGIMILICISAKPAGLAEMLFFTGGGVAVNCICNSDRPLTIAAPLVKMAFVALRRVRQTRNKNNLSSEDAQSERGAHFQSLNCFIINQSRRAECCAAALVTERRII